MAMIGSDPADLERLALLCEQASAEFGRGRAVVQSQLDGAFWEGPDAERFRSEWAADHAVHLSSVAKLLTETAGLLVKEAEMQRRVSR